ncbi:hypothetical protein FGO68_gene3617 [Halteria grandinella]|uniref:Uncharacterized protein n=1 Tax=Halteria grandinella TaxID=5974 RepID=A0A8J8NY05_HALGN|nr:hypothetical protein FGO68_gene3617 [Halteria grandinella]
MKSLRSIKLVKDSYINVPLYKGFLQMSKHTLKTLNISEFYGRMTVKNTKASGIRILKEDTFLEELEGSQILEELSIRGQKFPLSELEVEALPTFTNLRELTVEYFDQDAMQLMLEDQLCKGLSNLQSLELTLSLPDPVKALGGSHNCLKKIIYRHLANKTKVKKLSKSQTMEIVKEKIIGIKFYAPFSKPIELVDLSLKAIFIDLSDEVAKILENIKVEAYSIVFSK